MSELFLPGDLPGLQGRIPFRCEYRACSDWYSGYYIDPEVVDECGHLLAGCTIRLPLALPDVELYALTWALRQVPEGSPVAWTTIFRCLAKATIDGEPDPRETLSAIARMALTRPDWQAHHEWARSIAG